MGKMQKKHNRWFEAAFECRDAQDGGGSIIVGRPIVFGQETDLGWHREVIERGALDKTDMSDVFLFVNHEQHKIPLARSRASKSTMKLCVDDYGLVVEATLDTDNNNEARNLYSAVSRGDVTGMSFGFYVDSEKWEDLESDSPLRRITDIGALIEVSAVNFPAYGQTEIEARSKEALESARRKTSEDGSGSREREDKNTLELLKLKAFAL
jgi:HK97 family phage prohead protease